MLSLNSNQAAIIAGNITESAWLFDVVTAAGARYRWSLDVADHTEAESTDTWDLSFYTPSYEFKVIPNSFSGIELQRNRSEFNMSAPADVNFTVGNAGGALTASDFIDAHVTIRIKVSSATDTQTLPGWRFIVQRCESATGKLDFHCTSFIHRYLKGDWPNTELVRNLVVEETGTEINDNYCVPVIVDTAYIPLRSLYITDGRYYLLGPAANTFDVSEVSSPGTDQGKSTWLSTSYAFTQSTKTLEGADYRVVQPIIADADLDGVADSAGLWVSGGVVLDMPAKVEDTTNVDLAYPNRCIAYVLKDFGIPTDLVDDVESYSTFTTAETMFTSRGISFSGGYYYRRPRQEVVAELLNSCHSVLDVGEQVELRLLSKTSQKTIGLGDVVVSDTGGERNSRDLLSAFNYQAIIQVESDSGYVAFPAGDRSQAEMLKVLVPAKASTDEISGQTIALPLINDGIKAQSLACLYFQRRFLRYASLSFRGKPSLLALQPDDVVSFANAYFGGTYDALIESITINRDLSINFSLTRFKEALDDWDDLSFGAVVPVVDGSATSQTWSTITAGPASTPDGGRMPNSLPGSLRIGQTGNYILLDPSEPVMIFSEGGVYRMKIGDLGVDDYGIEFLDSNGVSIFRLDGSAGNTLSGWRLSQYALTDPSGVVGMSAAVTEGTDWRFWAGHATPGSAPYRVDENGNLYATAATISGTLVAATGTFNGVSIVYNHVTTPTGVVVTGGFIKTTSLGTRTGLVVADIDTTTEKQFTSYTWATSAWVERISLNSSGYAEFDGIFAGKGQGRYDTNTGFGVGVMDVVSEGESGDNSRYLSAFGYQALNANTTGHSCSAFGYQALNANTTGSLNSAFGFAALEDNTTGGRNSAFGWGSLEQNTDGQYNSAFGAYSLKLNVGGDYNCAFGFAALESSTGDQNSAFGRWALTSCTTGSNNLGLGFNAGYTASPFNVTTESNRIVLGDDNITNAYIKVAWTVTSDERDKADKIPLAVGLDFINDLSPVSFVWDDRSRYWETKDGEVIKNVSDGSKKSEQINFGFLAQQVREVEIKHGIPSNVIVNTEKEEKLLLKETALIPVLVKAIQELTAKVIELESKNKELK